jgi:repressor of nif and glnA expression
MYASTKKRRTMVAILRVLRYASGGLGSERIAEELGRAGIELSERAVRVYLAEADESGWTRNLGRRGRILTDSGRQEVDGALVMEKVGFVQSRVDELSYRMSFDIHRLEGSVIVNISTVSLRDAPSAVREMVRAFDANLGMGRLLAVRLPGEHIGDFTCPAERAVLATLCSVSINGILLNAKIAMQSRFGGLLQMEESLPRHFTQIITYDGSSLDPLEIFIRGHMTSVSHVARTGSGVIGASFREVPIVSLPETRRLAALAERLGLGRLLALGAPNQPLLDIPVTPGYAGVVVPGGLNPVAAVVEQGLPTTSSAMHTLCDFAELTDYNQVRNMRFPRMT